MRDSKLRQYTAEWLQTTRPQPMYDNSINRLFDTVFTINPVHNHNLEDEFKDEFINWLDGHTLNKLVGYKNFEHKDICVGCTQFIDDIYQRVGNNNVMIFEHDYKYHWRLNNDIQYVNLDTLDSNKELIISMPFPQHGKIHNNMNEILDKCYQKNIPVHVDGAWVSCSRDIEFNFNHPAITTFAISLSKGGLGNNRIALRFSKIRPSGAITIMNDFNMNNQALIHIGIQFMKQLGPEYFWKKYETEYYQVCRDFNLTPTNAIHIALKDNHAVGVRPLLRYLSKQ